MEYRYTSNLRFQAKLALGFVYYFLISYTLSSVNPNFIILLFTRQISLLTGHFRT